MTGSDSRYRQVHNRQDFINSIPWATQKTHLDNWKAYTGPLTSYKDIETFIYEINMQPGNMHTSSGASADAIAFRDAVKHNPLAYTKLLDLMVYARNTVIEWINVFNFVHTYQWATFWDSIYDTPTQMWSVMQHWAGQHTIAPAAPENLLTPQITGTAADGEVLTAWPGRWSTLLSTLETHYRWQEDGVDIVGAADAATFTNTSAQVGKRIRCGIRQVNAEGETEVFTAETDVVAAAAITITRLAYDGTATGLSAMNSTIATAQPDPLGGNNAIKITCTTNSVAGFRTSPTNNLVFKAGANRLTGYFKREAWTAAQAWLQWRFEDLTTNPLFSLSIDNPVLSPFYENNTAGILTACTITDAGSGWVYVDATITLSSMADLTGTFHMRMAKTRFAGQIDPPSADYAFSMYDVHVTKLP